MSNEENEQLKKHRQHQKGSENSQMVFGPGSDVTKKRMSNESERERWMRQNEIFYTRLDGYRVFRLSEPNKAFHRRTLNPALRALCQSNGWELPGFLREEET